MRIINNSKQPGNAFVLYVLLFVIMSRVFLGLGIHEYYIQQVWIWPNVKEAPPKLY